MGAFGIGLLVCGGVAAMVASSFLPFAFVALGMAAFTAAAVCFFLEGGFLKHIFILYGVTVPDG